MKPTDHKTLDSGFAMPIAIGFGAIMIILGTTMVIRSNQSQVASVSQRSSHQSLAAAESGVSQLISLFNTNRVFASSNLNDWEELRDEIRQLPNCNQFVNGDPIDSIIDAPNDVITIDPSDPDNGQYELISYAVTTPTGTSRQGTLSIRGIASDNRGTSVTDLEVSFPVDEQPINSSTSNTLAPECSSLATSIAATTPALPINDFGELNQQITASLTNDLRRTVSPSQLQGQTLPLSGDPNNMTYVIDNELSLTEANALRIRAGQTVFLVTQDNINALGDQAIQIENDASLFIVSYGDVTLRGTSAEPFANGGSLASPPQPTDVMENLSAIPLHIYLAGEGSLEVDVPAVSPTTADIPIVAYAPFGNVNLNLGTPTTVNGFKGEVWANNFTTNSAFSTFPNSLKTASTLSNSFWRERLDIDQLSRYSIRPINSWRRENT